VTNIRVFLTERAPRKSVVTKKFADTIRRWRGASSPNRALGSLMSGGAR